jgi:hypothetical protein
MMLLCWRVFTIPGRTFAFHVDWLWFHYAPAVVASLLLVPIILLDSLRMSNRFAGPMVRLRRAMGRLAEGESVQPINFRDNDFWADFAEDFNRMLARQQCMMHEMSNDHAEQLALLAAKQAASRCEGQLEAAIEQELALDEPSQLDSKFKMESRDELVHASGKR